MRHVISATICTFALIASGCDTVGLLNETGIPSGVYNGRLSITQSGTDGEFRETSTVSVTIDNDGFPADGAGLLERLVEDSRVVDLDERTIRGRTVRTVRRTGDTVTIDSRLEVTITVESPFEGFDSGRRQVVISGTATESFLEAPPNLVFSGQATLTVTEVAGPLVRAEPERIARTESGVLAPR